MKLICFDIGGTRIKYGVIAEGIIIFKDKMDTDAFKGANDIINRVILKAKELKEKYMDIDGVTISTAGVVDNVNGLIYSASDSIPGYKGFKLREVLEKELELKVIIENDVNSFAICEATIGASKGYDNIVTITVGTGIGGAIIINKELYVGKNFSGGEVGQMYLDGSTFEKLASASSLVAKAKDLGLTVKDGLEVFKLYEQNNSLAKKAVESFYYNLARGIANIIYMFNPEIIVIGGGVSERSQFLDELMPFVISEVQTRFLTDLKIVLAKYGNDAGMLGAYYNFINRCN